MTPVADGPHAAPSCDITPLSPEATQGAGVLLQRQLFGKDFLTAKVPFMTPSGTLISSSGGGAPVPL